MKALLKTLSTQELRVSGDGRFDTPGHSATFGVYTMMDSDTSKIISTELVKVCVLMIKINVGAGASCNQIPICRYEPDKSQFQSSQK